MKCAFISGTVDLQGCVHRFHSQGVGMSGPCPKDLLQGPDGGDPQEPAVCGQVSLPSEIGVYFGASLHFPSLSFGSPVFLDWTENLIHSASWLASGVQTCLSVWWPAHCVIHKEFFQSFSVYKAYFKLWNIQLPVLYPCVLGSLTLGKELDTWYILYCILDSSLCIQKEANSKVVCEIFFCSS